MKRESGLATLALLLLALFSLNTFAVAASLPALPNFGGATGVSPFEIDLTWRDRANDADGFQIERSTGDRTHFRQIAQVLPGTRIFRDKNLFPGTRYFYRIRAFNASGASRYSTTSARTQTPAVPLSVAEWGAYSYGQVTPTNTDLVSVSAGVYHSLGLKKDGTVIAWGANILGAASVPTNLTGVVAIAAGQFHSLALKSDGTVVEWGYGGGFQTPSPPPIILHPIPGPIQPPRPIFPVPPIPVPIHPIPQPQPIFPIQILPPVQLNPQVQPLSGPHLSTQSPSSPPDGLSGVVAISAASGHNVALKGDGTVVDWGLPFIVPPADLTGVVEIAASDTHSLALKSDGTVVQWGVLEPPPTNLTSVVAIAAVSGMSMAVKSDGTVVAWGYNSYPTILATSNLTDVIAIALASYQGVALKKDGSLFGWNLTAPTSNPPDLGTGIVAISGGGSDHFLALSTAPTAPSNPSATVLSATQVRFSWTDNSPDEKSFAIERQQQTAGPGDWTPMGTVGPNTTNYVDSTVTTNIYYVYRVRALGKFGVSPYSFGLYIRLAAPAPPIALYAALGTSNEVYLQWYDSYEGVDGYKLERAPDDNGQPGPWAEIGSLATPQSTFNDSTVAANHIYWYRVRAFNVLGFSDYSDTFSINVAPPSAPQNLYGSPSADSVSLNWSQDESTRGVKIERAPDVNGAPGAWTQIAIQDSTNGMEYSDKGLSLNTRYWYRVRAFNWTGDSPYSAWISVTVLPPSAPNQVYTSIGASNGVDISWYATINDEDGFQLERAPDAGGAPGPWSEIASFNDTNAYYETFHDTNVVANNTYWYRVRSFNIFGFSDYSTPVSISLSPPLAPTLYSPTTTADSVNLNWQTSEPNLLNFQLERAPDAGGAPGAWTQVATLLNLFRNYTDTNLTSGATYWYRIRAANWIGDSPYSSLVVVTIVPPAVPEIDFIALNPTNGVNLELRDNAGDEVGFLIERAVPTDLGFIDWTQIATVNPVPGATLASLTDTNAVPHATNYYRARTINSVGVSDYSATVSIGVTPPAPPYLNTSARSDSITVGIFPNNLTTEAVRGYRLQRAPDAGGHPGTWTPIAVIDATGANASYTESGLPIGVLYWYRAQAFNWVGDSDFSENYGVILSPPFAPTQLSVWLSVTNHQADLVWWDFSPDEDGFTLERAPDQNGAPGAWSQLATIYATNSVVTEFTDTNVLANTTNWYRVRAFTSASASEYSPVVSLAAVAPDPPVLSGNAFVNSARLSWYDSSSSVAGYQLERAPDSNGIPSAWLQITNTPDSEYTDNNLVADTTYWYRVRAYNWVGESDYSDPYPIAIVPPERPDSLTAALGTTNTVVLQWEDYHLDKDGFKIERASDAGGYPGDDWREIGTVSGEFSFGYSFADTNVMANTTNWYRVRAFAQTGFSEYDGDAVVRIMAPDTPQYLSTESGRHTIWIDWEFNTGIGTNGGYVLQRAPDAGGVPGVWVDIATNTQFVNYYTDSGLSVGTYWYRVRAFNWVGSSDFDSPVSGTISPISVPAKPDAPAVYMADTTNHVSMFWYDSASDEDGFKIQRAQDIGNGPGTWTEIGTVYATNSYYGEFTDTNAIANTTNWYRVQAFNSAGFSEFSDSNSVAVIPPASAPSMTPASVISAHRIDVRWHAEYDLIQGYRIERAFDVGGAPGPWSLIADIPIPWNDMVYSDIAVVMNQQYWYRVQSYNWSGASPYSDPFLVVDAPPAAPSLAVTNDQPHQFTLTWAIATNDITSIKIERAPDNNGIPGAWIQIAEPPTFCGLVPTNYTDIGIPTGQTFWYRVRAVNAVGDSPYSNQASATADATGTGSVSAAPTQPQILSLTQTNGGMLIEWSTTAGNTDVVQASGNFTGGYTNISPAMVIGGSGGTITNYFDAGALSSGPARFYRIKSSR